MKLWRVTREYERDTDALIADILCDRGIISLKQQKDFLSPKNPFEFTARDIGVDGKQLKRAFVRILAAIEKKESIVVYADYDADGITAGAVLWETLWQMGARVMPYIPHRVDEGYGLSQKGIDAVREQFDPTLIITVDHGITAYEKVEYAKSLGIDVIVTDHHVKPTKLPDCIIVHTTELSGSGVSWFVAKELAKKSEKATDVLALATIGTIADLVPLTGVNRSMVKFGLEALSQTKRVGVLALMKDAGIVQDAVTPYSISHMIAPRINAMGRIEHAIDALRLLCTKDAEKAAMLAQVLGMTNKQRQQMTEDSTVFAKDLLKSLKEHKKLIFVSDASFNQGIIGLVAGRLVEEHYRPAIVLAVGEMVSKASARSIKGFNIIEAIRSAQDLLVDAGGHPMAAGFTVETKNIEKLKNHLEKFADELLTEELLTRSLHIDVQIPLSAVTEKLWNAIRQLEPFGIGNPEPVFATKQVLIKDAKIIGATKKHLKFKVSSLDCVAFNMADLYGQLSAGMPVDIAYSIDMNEWNGKRSLQLKIKDIQLP